MSSRSKRTANSSDANLSYEFEQVGETLTIKLAGEADLYGSSSLRQALIRRLDSIERIVFDLERLEFADSYFLRLLIKLRKRLGGVASVRIVNVKPNVRKIFEVTGLDQLFM